MKVTDDLLNRGGIGLLLYMKRTLRRPLRAKLPSSLAAKKPSCQDAEVKVAEAKVAEAKVAEAKVAEAKIPRPRCRGQGCRDADAETTLAKHLGTSAALRGKLTN